MKRVEFLHPRRAFARAMHFTLPAIVSSATLGAQGVTAKRPEIPAPAPYRFPAVVERTLPNGLRVVVLQRSDLPLVVTRVALAGGAPLADPPAKEGTFQMMRQLLNEGTAARSVDSLARRFADMGSPVGDNGFVTLAANLDTSLAILAELIRNPLFRETDFERVRTQRLANARTLRTEGNLITTRMLTGALFGNTHPFARFESEESLGRITRDDIAAVHASWVRPPNVTLVIVGDVAPAAAFARVERFFGDWPRGSGASVESVPLPTGPVGEKPTAIYLTDAPTATAYIRMAGLSAARSSPDVPALDVMNAVYGALTGSRLQRELRENRGLTYSSPSAFQWRAAPTPSIFYSTLSSVAPARVDSAVSTLFAELKGIAGENPPTDDEFEFGRTNRIASLPLQLETHEAMATRLTELVVQRLPLDYFSSYVAGLRSVTRAHLVDAARRHVDPSRTVITVVGEAAILEPALRALNIGPVFVFDLSGKRIR